MLRKITYIASIFWFAIVFIKPTISSAQPTTDQQLASFYFQEEDFEKAAIYYQKLYSNSPSDIYYSYYLQCLLKLKNFKEAKKLVKTQIKIQPNVQKYKVDMGLVLKQEGDPKAAEKEFDNLIKNLQPIHSNINDLAQAFADANEFNYALKTFEQGDKLLNGTYPFQFEKARLYGRMAQYELMFDEYLALLNFSETYLQTIQNELARNLAYDEESKQNVILKSRLLREIQKNPNKTVFSELLIWTYLQDADYAGALRQSKALDKRQNEDGSRIIEISHLARSAKNFNIAIEALDYIVLDKGINSPYYTEARVLLVDVLKEKLTSGGAFTKADVAKLSANYKKTIADLGLNFQTIKLQKDYASLLAFYANKPDSAAQLLENAINVPRISPTERAECKLTLGDVYLIQGYIWDASILYSQVDKEFKYDVLGEQAKFKNAKISFYTGDFRWAKAQLDVLKGSTSKLISNDAMELSLVITDNTGIDTTEIPLEMYARADLLTYQNNFNQALSVMDSISSLYPEHSLSDDILYKKFVIFKRLGNYEEAASYLEKLIQFYPTDILADNAVFELAKLHDYFLNNPEKAKDYYQKLLLNYQDSLFVVDARKRFRTLRGDNLNIEQ